MHSSSGPRLSVDRLESRDTPAVTAGLVNGSLVVGGSATQPGGQIRIQGTFTGPTFQVFDSGVKVGDYAVTSDLRVNLGGADDKLEIDFGSFSSSRTLAGNLTVNLGGGNDSALVGFGGAGNVSVSGGSGDDTISFQRFGTFGNLSVNGGAGTKDVVNVFAETDVTGSTAVSGGEDVLVGTRTPGSVTVSNGSAMAVNVFGNITGDVTVMSGGGKLDLTGRIGGNVFYLNNFLGTTGANLRVGGEVNGAVVMLGTAAADTVEFSQFSRAGRVLAFLGAGDDQFTRPVGATLPSVYVNGGAGINIYTGVTAPAGQTLIGFGSPAGS